MPLLVRSNRSGIDLDRGDKAKRGTDTFKPKRKLHFNCSVEIKVEVLSECSV